LNMNNLVNRPNGKEFPQYNNEFKREEINELLMYRRTFPCRIAKLKEEYQVDILSFPNIFQAFEQASVDIFTFIDQSWSCPINAQPTWVAECDNVAIIKLNTYEDWWKTVGKKTRNMIRKAKKNGIETRLIEINEEFAKALWKNYNETPVRQGRGSLHYGDSLEKVTRSLELARKAKNRFFIGAYLNNELVGFTQIAQTTNASIIHQLLSSKEYWDTGVNNALISAAIEFCCKLGEKWLIYGRIGDWRHVNENENSPLDEFKKNNGFSRFEINRFYVPLTSKGKLALRLNLHKRVIDILPPRVKYYFIQVYYWISRNVAMTRFRIKSARIDRL
jgi:hypothetical protein